MAVSPVHPRRRRFIKLTATGLAVAPFANALQSGNACAADMVKESDPAAVKLKYKADATKAAERTSPTEFCDNCLLYTSSDNASGTCSALGDRLVAAKGWCTSWGG
jgi:hypothetical protein